MHSTRRSTSLTVSVGVLTIGALAIVTATAGAAVTVARAKLHLIGRNGVIHQCVADKGYATRTLPTGKHCASNETAHRRSATTMLGNPSHFHRVRPALLRST